VRRTIIETESRSLSSRTPTIEALAASAIEYSERSPHASWRMPPRALSPVAQCFPSSRIVSHSEHQIRIRLRQIARSASNSSWRNRRFAQPPGPSSTPCTRGQTCAIASFATSHFLEQKTVRFSGGAYHDAQIQSCCIHSHPSGSLGVAGVRACRILFGRKRRSATAACHGPSRASTCRGLGVDRRILRLGWSRLGVSPGAMGAATSSGVCLAATLLRASPQRLPHASRTLGTPPLMR
jgi:hypothetical protein